MSSEMEGEEISGKVLYEHIAEIIESETIKKLSSLRRQRILLSDFSSELDTVSLQINREYFDQVIDELVKNALKFSPPASTVTIMMRKLDKKLGLSFLNSVTQLESDSVEGIPHDYQNVVFEPFFRIVTTVFDEYDTLDYGLGLTLVDKIVRKHKGRVEIGNILDYTNPSKTPVKKVMVQIIL